MMNETERLKAACDLLMQEVVRLQYAVVNARIDAQAAQRELATLRERPATAGGSDGVGNAEVVSITR